MNVLKTLNALIQACLGTGPGLPPLPTVLDRVGEDIAALGQVELDPSGDGVERWLATLRRITGNVEARETLIIRMLQVHLPRLAELLAFGGVISMQVDRQGRVKSFTIDWPALDRFLKDPSRQVLATVLSRVPSLPNVHAVQALFLLLLTRPTELVAREYDGKGFFALPVGDGVTSLQDLIDLVNSPIAVPLGPQLLSMIAGDRPFVEQLAELKQAGGFPPDGTPRIAVLGPDSLDGVPAGRRLDAFRALVEGQAAALGASRVKLGDWTLTADAKGSGSVKAGVHVDNGALAAFAEAAGTMQVRFFLGTSGSDDALLLGDRSGTFVAIRDAKVGIAVASEDGAEPTFGYSLQLDGVRLGVGTGVLAPLAAGLRLPGSITFDSDVNLSYLLGHGAQGAGVDGLSLAMEIPRHLGFAIGGPGLGLWLDDVVTRLEVSVARTQLYVRALLRFDARAEIGPLQATVTGAGAWLGRWSSGNAGVVEPTGIGLTLDAGPISGSGFFGKLGPGEYGGAMSLTILGIGAFAYGIYRQLPAGGVSFVAVIGLRLPPPGIQIGFGFAISGFGGLVGLHRRADTDKLRDKLVSGTAGDVLFTDDPTKNAPRILGELRTLFPERAGTHVFGPTFQLNWLSVITLDAGLFIELPGPSKIFIAGSGRLVLGSEDFALVYFRMDFVGGIDTAASLMYFDGALVNSRLLGAIRITGGLAFRLGFGANPYFLFSVGGFHPAFNPGGIAVPQVPRAGASIDLGIVWLSQQAYFAVTSNTVQFGARTEAGVKIGPIKVHGWFGFDALVQLRPFHFVADIDAGMAATFEGIEFASIRVRGQLTGPGPLVLRASASVKVIIRISKNVTITLDRTPQQALPEISNLAEHLAGEISKPANLRGEGADPDVVFSSVAQGAEALVPAGRVIWEQKRVPLGRTLERVDACPLDPHRMLTVEVRDTDRQLLPVEEEGDLFAVGTFATVSDAEALSAPTFSAGRSGFRLDLAQRFAGATAGRAYTPSVDVIRLPHRTVLASRMALRVLMHAAALQSMAERATGAAITAAPTDVVIKPEPWAVPGGPPQHAADAFLEARSAGAVAMPVSTPLLSLDGVL